MRTLVLHKAVLKEFPSLPPKQYRQVVSAIFDLLTDVAPHYSQPLAGSAYSRIAVGEYRVVYRYDDQAVYVAAFGKRNDGDVYRSLDRKF